MLKFILKYTIIIFVNLFAFLTLWHILDGIFDTGKLCTVIFLILSIVSLVLISHFFIKKTLITLNNIKAKHRTNDWK